jgi:creatinine amidohydrolase
MRLEHLSWVEVKDYFESNNMILLPIGSIECHGKHMPLGTDYLIPQKIIDLLEPLTDILITPVIPYGCTESLSRFPGTISLGQDVLLSLLNRVIAEFVRHGARKVIVLNGHSGNGNTIEQAGLELRRQGGLLTMLNWWEMAEDFDPSLVAGHGGALETSAILGIDPKLVKTERIEEMNLVNPCDELIASDFFEVRFQGVRVPLYRFTNEVTQSGWIGSDHPKFASEEQGQQILQRTAEWIAEFIKAFKKVPL